MNQTSGRSAAPPLDAETEDHHTTSSLKGGGLLGRNHIAHKSQVDPALCASLASSLLHKTQNSFSDSLSVKIDIDLAAASAEDDEDSGLPDSSIKASSSLKTSVGFSDSAYDDSEDDRPGSFDYMPCQSGHVRIKHSFNPPYDEEVKVDSSTGDSSVESPRSETSVTHDEYNVADEGTEMFTLSYKETPHQPFAHEHKHIHHVWDYTQKHSDDESMEDEEEERSRVLGTSYKASSSRQVEVDDGISYNLKPLGSCHLGRQFTMTPCGPYVEQYKSDGSKEKKDKKKRKSKDDSDKPEVPGLVDINGNPSLPEPANYSQMRQLSRGKSDSFASVSLVSSSSSPNSQTCNSSTSSSASEINKLDRKKERKRMKLEKQKWTPAEAYEDHKDFQDIKEILDFVEGFNSSNRSEGKSVKKKQERSKKKDQHSKLDDAVGGEDGPAGLATIVTAAARPDAVEAMGNSSVKSLAEDDDDDDSKTDSAQDNLDKYSEFHDCLNTLPAEHIISDGRADKPEKLAKTNSSNLSEPEKLNTFITKDNNKSDTVLTDNNKSVSKKSTKAKSKKEKQDTCQENGPLSPKVKPKESLEMNNPILTKTSPANEDVNVHSSNEKEMLLELKREDSFTEVKKRKKRIGGKDSNIALSNHSSSSLHYHQHSESGHSHRNNLRPVTGTPPPSSTSGAVIVTYSNISLPIIDQTRSSRDLSPSAFPVLSGHAPLPTLHKEARRNSCGDITTDSIDSKTYDSDRESAKSLPDAHGVRVCGDMSPVYPVSYARMVAAPRRNDSTNSPSSESGVVSGSQNSSVNSSITHTPGSSSDIASPQPTNSIAIIQERKATVWKGSPRERRHSIGSSPDDKIEGDKSSVTQRNRQCGSQEVLSRDCSASTASQSTRASSTMLAKIPPTIEGSIVLTHTEQVLHPAAPNIPSSQSATRLPVQQSAKTAASEHATLSFVSPSLQESLSATLLKESTIIPAKEKVNEVTAAHIAAPDLSKTKNETTGSADSGLRVMLVPSKNKTAPVPPNSARKICGSTNNSKSVIFLDKRFDASLPQSLGITFGFDSSFESTVEPATSQSTGGAQQSSHTPNQQPASVTVLSSSSSSQTSSVCSSGQQQQQPLPCPTAHPHIPQTAPSSSMPAGSTTSSLQSSDNSNNKIVPKAPHIQGPRNGIILPSSPAILSEQVTSSSSGDVSTSKDDNNISSISSDRTNSQLQTESQVNNHSKSSTANSGPLILPVLQGTSPALQANGPLAQLSKSTQHMITLNSSVTITRANPAGVTYSLNYPPPPISQAVVTAAGDNSNSTSALPSAQDKPEPNNPANNKSNSSSAEPPGSFNSSTITKDPLGGSETSSPVTDTSSAAETAVLQQQQQPQQQLCSNAVPSEVLQSAVHVMYGEKIKSGAGCGRLLFVPNELPQKNKGNAAEVGQFLRRRWFEEVQQKKGSGIFQCCD